MRHPSVSDLMAFSCGVYTCAIVVIDWRFIILTLILYVCWWFSLPKVD